MRRILAPVWHPSALLLFVQLAGVLLYPFMDLLDYGRAVFSVFGLLVVALAVRAVKASPALTWVSFALGLPILLLTFFEIGDPANAQVVLVAAILFAVFYAYTSYAMIRYMFHGTVVSSDTLYATGATFTVVAWGFAYVFVAVELVWPGSFSGTAAGTSVLGWFDMLFLSFTTLTSVGLSDIVPLLPHARSIVMIEEVAGLLYVALVISRVSGLTLLRRREAVGAAPSATPATEAGESGPAPTPPS